MRKLQFENGKYYHVYNRGVDKRSIVQDENDLKRFLLSLQEFNCIEPIGSLYAHCFRKKKQPLRDSVPQKLVHIICYCVNPNHFHLILEQCIERGVEKFMHKLGSGYTTYFNKRHKRSGALFQGQYKAILIDSDTYLLHASAYVNLNNKAHQLQSVLFRSSWKEYIKDTENFCKKDAVLSQFTNGAAYKSFAERALRDIIERKEYQALQKELVEI